jgi:hypothetical protein
MDSDDTSIGEWNEAVQQLVCQLERPGIGPWVRRAWI